MGIMREFRFYKENERWWVDLPAYTAQGGDPTDLQMVAGADDFLDILDEKANREVKIQIVETKKEGFSKLIRCDEIPTTSGRYYFDDDTDNLMWLCDVMLWIFGGRFPETIWYKTVKQEEK